MALRSRDERAIVTYLGVNLLAALDEDRTRVDGLFARLEALVPLIRP